MDITTIPPRHRIVVARVPDGWVCVLVGSGMPVGDDEQTWEQARANAVEIWHADPATCMIVDARDPQWQQVSRDSWRVLRMMARERGE